MIRRLGGALAVAAACLMVTSAWAETVEEVEAKIKQAYDNLKSYSAKMSNTTEMSPAGSTFRNDQKGTMEWARDGGKVKMRMEMKGKIMTEAGGQKNEFEGSSTMVCDGDVMWAYTEQMGQKSAVKMKPDPKQIGDSTAMFEEMKKDHELKVLDSVKVDGADTYVVQATPKSAGADPGYANLVFHFRKDNGMMVKMVGKDKAGKETMNMTLSDVKTNINIPADRFKFTPPEGVQVMDMTNQGGGK